MSAQVRQDAVIVAAGCFLNSPDIGYSVTRYRRPVLWSWASRVRTASRSAGGPTDRRHTCRGPLLYVRLPELCPTFARRS